MLNAAAAAAAVAAVLAAPLAPNLERMLWMIHDVLPCRVATLALARSVSCRWKLLGWVTLAELPRTALVKSISEASAGADARLARLVSKPAA